MGVGDDEADCFEIANLYLYRANYTALDCIDFEIRRQPVIRNPNLGSMPIANLGSSVQYMHKYSAWIGMGMGMNDRNGGGVIFSLSFGTKNVYFIVIWTTQDARHDVGNITMRVTSWANAKNTTSVLSPNFYLPPYKERSLRGHAIVALRTLNLLVVSEVGLRLVNRDDRVLLALEGSSGT